MSNESVQIPKCAACWLGGQQRRPVEGKTMKSHNDGILSANKLKPGDLVFSDQYVCSQPGKNFNSRGQEQRHLKYMGGTIFYDSASKYVDMEHQIGFTASETVTSKISFERRASYVGVEVKEYRTDNGVYTSKTFGSSLDHFKQKITHSGEEKYTNTCFISKLIG